MEMATQTAPLRATRVRPAADAECNAAARAPIRRTIRKPGSAADRGDVVNGLDCRPQPVPVRRAIPESVGRPASRERRGRPGRPVQAGPQGP